MEAYSTGLRLESILRDYLSRLERSALTSPTSEIPAMRGEVKPLNLLVITDGGQFVLLLVVYRPILI
jgi:hypothetical protein